MKTIDESGGRFESNATGAGAGPKAPSERLAKLAAELDLRRGILFLIAIGVPLLVGLLRGEKSGALIGALTGMLLCLADTEGSLGKRVRMGVIVAGGIALGAFIGVWLKGLPSIFWGAFFVTVFAAGLLNQVGKGPHFAVRFGAIALAVVVGLPSLAPIEIAYWAAAVLLVIVSRILDHALNGGIVFAGPWLGNAELGRSGWIRFALAYAVAATIGLWIGVQSGSIRAVWISAITLLLMLPDIKATYIRVFDGALGTVFAVAAVWLLGMLAAPPALLITIVLGTAVLLPSQFRRFSAFSGMIAIIVLLTWELASSDPKLAPLLPMERLEDMLIGGVLVLSVTVLSFPRQTLSLVREADWRSRRTDRRRIRPVALGSASAKNLIAVARDPHRGAIWGCRTASPCVSFVWRSSIDGLRGTAGGVDACPPGSRSPLESHLP